MAFREVGILARPTGVNVLTDQIPASGGRIVPQFAQLHFALQIRG
jgi:hypothetical protein